MTPTDIRNPDYFHKVVDCQWACPAHTPVPEYIRLIAAGRYGDAYMVNWKSNVFPGILGRTCDRPCEPACRRGRVEEENQTKPEPVAICRLKRVAADNKDGEQVKKLIEKNKKTNSNGKKIACVGAGHRGMKVILVERIVRREMDVQIDEARRQHAVAALDDNSVRTGVDRRGRYLADDPVIDQDVPGSELRIDAVEDSDIADEHRVGTGTRRGHDQQHHCEEAERRKAWLHAAIPQIPGTPTMTAAPVGHRDDLAEREGFEPSIRF